MARIALDAMGGDNAPQANIAGALQALDELDASHVVQLVGKSNVIEQELNLLLKGEPRFASLRERITLVDAPDTISMSDKPTAALRSGSNNPMAVGIRLQADDASEAFVSAGNTGAQMAVSALLLGRLAGVTRPAVATVFPTAKRPIVFLDSGANVDCSAAELVQFAWLGSVYAEFVLGRKDPIVGLLSIGEEKEKGNSITKAAHSLFQAAGFNFYGNVEGRDLPAGATDRSPIDVVVCDGFTGNIVLKFYEAVMPMIVALLTAVPSFDQAVLERALGPLDSTSYGGAPLLGVRGVSIICHGNSPPRAIKNAIKVAVRAVETRMNEHIEERLSMAASLNSGQVA
ncbi:MAG TPA: phosphate acyltransferase PlsX [Gemmatimonadaceae bacterium]|nr:phosphate acyltransferase PlsX [Gemmatimonadaceae bacterium]